MRIGICEDNLTHGKLIRQLLSEWAAARGVPLEIETFQSAENFLFLQPDARPFDLLLLDIQMGKMNGMELARQLRREKNSVPIAFLTALKDYAFEGYGVGAVHYLLKPICREALWDCLDRVTKVMASDPVAMLVVDNRRLRQSEILYAESDSHYVRIHLAHEAVTAKKNFRDLLNLLDPRMFTQCHRSYVVNLSAVERLTRNEILLDNGERIPLSRTYWQDANRAFIGYHGKDIL
ncbi:MAG TPA: LytTR family DNA-binding domain-containing protein [Eubacteriales bacterium]|nr:LytTR family DNA-binding domain-containing protein [Eubacteriales bacterium]